jgi:tetratricopeptide (TPR) repeat protein
LRRSLYLILTAFCGVSVALAYQDLGRGIELYNARRYSDAVRALQAVAESQPDNAEAHTYLGLAHISMGNAAEAEAALNRAAELAPDSDAVRVGQARVSIENKQFDRARSELQRAAEINESNPDIPLYRGALNVAQRNYQAAVNELNQAIERNRNNPYAYYYIGLAYNGLKRPDKMVESFETFLKLAPDLPEAERVRSLLRSVR